jgi:glycosyltransferase involved in cell wall biosynthesis
MTALERPSQVSLGISVCMPAFNEAENLGPAVKDAVRVMGERFARVEIVVANDGSRDGTAEVLEGLRRHDDRVRALHHPHNLGYGAAVRTALAAATEELILLTDADRQFALEDVDRLLGWADTHDLVVGFRAPRRDPWPRVCIGQAWTGLANLLCGYLARDVNCAFKLVWGRAFRQVAPLLQCHGATFSAEWLAWSRRAGLRIQEVPVRHYPRQAGAPTGARWVVMARAVRELLALRMRLARHPAPRAQAATGREDAE